MFVFFMIKIELRLEIPQPLWLDRRHAGNHRHHHLPYATRAPPHRRRRRRRRHCHRQTHPLRSPRGLQFPGGNPPEGRPRLRPRRGHRKIQCLSRGLLFLLPRGLLPAQLQAPNLRRRVPEQAHQPLWRQRQDFLRLAQYRRG